MKPSRPSTLPLFVGAVFIGAFLSFSVEPLVGKMLLPRYGGTPAVWNTTLVFFQLLLLAGYAYAHVVVTRVGARSQPLLHVGVAVAAFVFLPPALRTATPPATTWPVASVLATLALAVSGPFLALTATSTLVQAWLAGAGDEDRDPYWLYAASNLGSLLGLLAYPFLIEPRWDLATQAQLWAIGYTIYALAMIAIGWRMRAWPRSASSSRADVSDASLAASGADPGTPLSTPAPTSTPPRQWLGWIARPAVASSLLMAVTMHITTDIAAVPLLWIVPLALYLMTFILAFGRPLGRFRPWLVATACLCLVLALASLFIERSLSLGWRLAADLSVLFFGAWALHDALAADRPEPARLSHFYLAVSLGGAIGGVLNSLVAPLVFKSVFEYPITLAATAWLAMDRRRPSDQPSTVASSTISGWRGKLRVLAILGTAIAVIATSVGYLLGWSVTVLLPVSFVLLITALALAWVPDVFRVTLALIVVMLLFVQTFIAPPLDQGRSFFGVLRVGDTGDIRVLVHGTTIHGAQHISGNRREALTYFHADGPLAKAMNVVPAGGRVAIVGLGAGSLATYVQPGQHLDFYEIDPLVETMARKHFSFLADCRGEVAVILGDARLRIEEAPDASYDLLLVDAFSGDSIPVHLLTREAIDLYFRKLKPGGIVVLHLSNRYLDFEPVLRGLDATDEYLVRTNRYTATAEDHDRVHYTLNSAVVARREADLAPLLATGGWHSLDPGRTVLWTDGFSNVVGLLRNLVTTN